MRSSPITTTWLNFTVELLLTVTIISELTFRSSPENSCTPTHPILSKNGTPTIATFFSMAWSLMAAPDCLSLATISVSQKKRVEVVEPGLVILRNFIDDEACQRIAAMAKDFGDEFYTVNKEGEKILNTGESRGRIYDAATRFPRDLIQLSNDAVSTSRAADTSMPAMQCTHVLLNLYTTSEGLVWHRDIYENDGKSDHPVVNLSIGATCVFGFKHLNTDEERTVELRSGDILLFGGPCRLIKHAVLEIKLDDAPEWMSYDPSRFSFTFRDSPEVLGREEEFKYFRVKEDLVGQEDFKVPTSSTDRKAFHGLPSYTTQQHVSMAS